jgi:hypothetical protein
MLFKGPGPFKKKFKIGGNVDELKAYRLIPLTPPLFFHFTLPLSEQESQSDLMFLKTVQNIVLFDVDGLDAVRLLLQHKHYSTQLSALAFVRV